MAKRLAIPSKELQLSIVSARGAYKAARIQRLGLNTDITSTTVDELGSAIHVGYSKDLPNVTLTFTGMDVGVKLVAALAGYDSSTWPVTGVDVSQLGEMDAVIYIKDPDASKYIKAAHARRLQIRDFTYNFSSDGEATEDYTAIGSEKRFFNNNVAVETLTAGATSMAALSGTPVILKNGKYLLTVRVKNTYLDPETTGTPAAGFYNYNSGTKVIKVNDADKATASDKAIVLYQSAASTSTWADVSDLLEPVAVKGRDIDVVIAANNIPRVQSVTINGTLNTQPVREMGNRVIVGYQKQIPEITGNITVLDTDTELISLFQFGVTASGTEFQPGEGCTQLPVSLVIKMYDPCDDEAATLLKAVTLDQIGVTGDSYTGNVNQNTTQTFNWRSVTGTCVVSGIYNTSIN